MDFKSTVSIGIHKVIWYKYNLLRPISAYNLLLLIGGFSIECISCSWNISLPMVNPNCYDFANPDDPLTPVLDCSAFPDAYCQTEFELVDGT